MKLDLYENGGDGTMPLVFNRTETNQQYVNLTLSAKLDSINILKNEVYQRPVKTGDESISILNQYDYNDFVGDPETVKIFRTEISLIGESTFAEIYVNCSPEKTTNKKMIPKTKILGIGIEYVDKIVRRIKMSKILKPVVASKLASAGNKNEIIVDIRLGFTESEQILTYYNIGDIFSELGGIIGFAQVIISGISILFVLWYVLDFAAFLKRKSSHKFRNQTIIKYKKCLP